MNFHCALNRLFIIKLTAFLSYSTAYAEDLNNVNFNTDLLDIVDKENIELGSFSKPGYVMPGEYVFKLLLNNDYLAQEKIAFFASGEDKKTSTACFTPETVKKFGLLKDIVKTIKWDENGCLVIESLDGMTVKSDLSKGTLRVNIPQAYLEYRTETWDPPSLWDNGISGVVFDYNVLSRSIFQHNSESDNQTYLNANGIMGFNFDAWRVRANWQANYNFYEGSKTKNQHDFSWSSIYAYRAIPSLKSQLTLGENYLRSDLFDSFRYTGASLISDVSMLPPNLRGYAPEVTGVAQSNATVIISQQGRVITQTQVPAGPFRIQNLSDTISGQLNVRVEEENGSVQEFNVDTATIPYLTRPGAVRFKTSVGRPSTFDHKLQGDLFATGEFSWGVTNGWSLFGGSLNSKDYNAVSLGVGRDLLALGALSFDITQSFADLPEHDNLQGRSYRLSYAKQFKDYDSQIQFAGYRFAEKDYLSMSDFLAIKNSDVPTYTIRQSKEMYTISLNKMFPASKTSVFFNFNRQTYWNSKSTDYYNLMLSQTLNFDSIKNVGVSLSAYQNRTDTKDYGGYLAISLPLDVGGSVNYAYSHDKGNTSEQVSYYDRVNDRLNYQVSANHSDLNGIGANAYLTYNADRARITANASSQKNSSSVGFSAQGGLTLTARGVDFHRVSSLGSTRVLVDTNKIEDVPVQAYGPTIKSNRYGKAIVSNVTNYYKNRIKVNVNKLPKNAEVTDSIVFTTLTEGAIGYKEFDVLAGEKRMVTLRSNGGEYIPFGTQITNEKGRATGIVDEKGLVYLSGISLHQKMVANLGDDKKCFITITAEDLLNENLDTLTCELDSE
jgi:outer membrane usher protein PapC